MIFNFSNKSIASSFTGLTSASTFIKSPTKPTESITQESNIDFLEFPEETSGSDSRYFVSSEETQLSKMFSRLNLTSKKIQKKPLNSRKCAYGDSESRKKVVWSTSEDKLVWLLYKTVGAQWSKIAECLEDKTEAQVKHRFLNHLKLNAEEHEETHKKLLEAMVNRYRVESH